MSTLRTTLSRPRRAHDTNPRRFRSRHALIATVLLAVSACTAVAADGLPTIAGDEVDGEVRAEAGIETDSEADAPDEVAPSDPVGGTSSTAPLPASPTAGDGDLAPRADGRSAADGDDSADPEVDDEVGGAGDETDVEAAPTDEGTIVAHAVSPTVTARVEPSGAADPVADFANPTDRGGPLVFQAVGDPRDGWLEVLLPVRPNGTTGWIELDDVTLSRNPYRIEVDLENYELTVSRFGDVEISAPIAIGQGETPTPIGDFYLIELLQPPEPNGPYGSYAYGLSGYSDVLDNFNGGDGVIGIHGTNRPDLLGGPASHGCIRIHNDTIELMAEFLPLGTPVAIIEADTDG